MECRAFWRAKWGNRRDECEDACSANSLFGRFAVADGASESAYAGSWATWLVEHFVKESTGPVESWLETLPGIQAGWMAGFEGRELPWYSEAKLQHGAFATFLGLIVTDDVSDAATWEAIAIGDSCLFHTRGEQLLSVFPVTQADQFTNSPRLLGSRTAVSEIRANRLRSARGELQRDDRLWLMTDALAHWCLTEHQAARNPWQPLDALREAEFAEEDFANWIDQLRDNRQIHNDDVTLLAVWR
jgi:hypothetical protein